MLDLNHDLKDHQVVVLIDIRRGIIRLPPVEIEMQQMNLPAPPSIASASVASGASSASSSSTSMQSVELPERANGASGSGTHGRQRVCAHSSGSSGGTINVVDNNFVGPPRREILRNVDFARVKSTLANFAKNTALGLAATGGLITIVDSMMPNEYNDEKNNEFISDSHGGGVMNVSTESSTSTTEQSITTTTSKNRNRIGEKRSTDEDEYTTVKRSTPLSTAATLTTAENRHTTVKRSTQPLSTAATITTVENKFTTVKRSTPLSTAATLTTEAVYTRGTKVVRAGNIICSYTVRIGTGKLQTIYITRPTKGPIDYVKRILLFFITLFLISFFSLYNKVSGITTGSDLNKIENDNNECYIYNTKTCCIDGKYTNSIEKANIYNAKDRSGCSKNNNSNEKGFIYT